MKLTEKQIRNVIAKVISESLAEPNPFEEIDNQAREKCAEIRNQIEMLSNQEKTLMGFGSMLSNLDAEIKKNFQGIQGPVKERHYYAYVLPQQQEYDEDDVEYAIMNMIPDQYGDSISVYADSNTNKILISIDVDGIQGWY